MLIVGLDIGGANLKAATSDAAAADRAFPLWKQPHELSTAIAALLANWPQADAIALTMTGELADCFPTKVDGVAAILDAVQAASKGLPLACWQTGGEFVTADEAAQLPRLVASANWHALATFCGRIVPHGDALLIDVGSTTTDLIPLHDGRVTSAGLTDLERLRSGELVYTGARRTPVCAIGSPLDVEGRLQPMAAEMFATLGDVYLVLGEMADQPDDLDTADGRPATRHFARQRLARMMCADIDELEEGFVERFAAAVARHQRAAIEAALDRALDRMGRPPQLLLSGSGSFIARQVVATSPRVLRCPIVMLEELFEKTVSRSACAFAVARLAAERMPF